ncbi:MAG: hypothetical protein RJP95_03770 [Pirellulales bacterium]
MRVLLADRDEAFLHTVRGFLRHRGHNVNVVTNGIDCISLFRAELPDALIIERELLWGGSDGVLELLAEDIRDSKPLVILTIPSDWDTAYLAPSKARSITACLSKPFHLQQLLILLQSTGRRHAYPLHYGNES